MNFKTTLQKLKRIKNHLLKTPEPVNKISLECYRWLYENFPRLEELALEIKASRKKRKCKRENKFLTFFFDSLSENIPKDKESVIELFRKIQNTFCDVGLGEAKSLSMYLKTAILHHILCAYEESTMCNDESVLERIKNLFCLLDKTGLVSEESVLECSGVEKMLRNDPAGVYISLTDATKNSYRENLVRLAKKNKALEVDFAAKIVEECKNKKCHIGAYLCDKPHGGYEYLATLFFVTLAFTILLGLVNPIFVFFAVPTYFAVKTVAEKFFVKFVCRNFHLPEIELAEIPDGEGVMVVITSLLHDNCQRLCEKIESIYHSNGGENVYFALLCDLSDSDENITEKDERLLKNINEKIRSLRLKYDGKFFLFVRERSYSNSEEKYVARERKRGAVCDLVSFLCCKSDEFCDYSIKPDEKVCKNVKYVLTLDEDTNPEFDCVKHLVGKMMHPQNTPVLNKQRNCVVKGYGILQPRMETTLFSAYSTFFTRVMCARGGVDNYNFGGSEKNMSLFGKSFFCGKGIFDKNVFYETLIENFEFEDEKILSHDLPEGARLGCAHVPDVVFTDSFPKESLSYFKRKHRWIRGDVQNVPFLKGNVKSRDGNKCKNNIDAFSKFFILENVLSALLPVSSFLLIVLSVLFDVKTALVMQACALSPYFLPFFKGLACYLKPDGIKNALIAFYSKDVYKSVFVSFANLVFVVSAMAESAKVSMDAIVRSVYRSAVSHKKMLEWTTFSMCDEEKHDGLLGYVKKHIFSAFSGTFLLLFSNVAAVKFVGLLWFFMPVFAYHVGKKRKETRREPNMREREILLSYCRDMWKYFDENVTEKTNHLPPDNVSFLGETKVSKMTSPTNIGLYLLSCVCARGLGIIDTNEMENRLTLCLETVSKLEKYHGILCNWYNVYTAKPYGERYLSSVDMGNFLACIIAVQGAICDYNEEMKNGDLLRGKIQNIIDDSELEVLFDEDKKLFRIGAVIKGGAMEPDENHYDILMSEARILSFVAVSLGKVKKEHLKMLSRRLCVYKNHIGLCSWSGTVFEYFMPEIFYESQKSSFVYEALCFCHETSKRRGMKVKDGYIFGVSESCYNSLDDMGNYKYFAFGLDELSLSTARDERVFSPYSAFLQMPFFFDDCFLCLESFKGMGMYGKYGFYESADFERHDKNKSADFVLCFMSHHIGMSMASCTNLLLFGAVRGWFMKNGKIGSARELTEEKIPLEVGVKGVKRYKIGKMRDFSRGREETSKEESYFVELQFADAKISAKKSGVNLLYDDIRVIEKASFPESLGSVFVGLETSLGAWHFDSKCRLSKGKGFADYSGVFENSNGKYECHARFSVEKNVSTCFRIKVSLFGTFQDFKDVSCVLSFVPSLCKKEDRRLCLAFEEKCERAYVLRDCLYFTDSREMWHLFASALSGECEFYINNGIFTVKATPKDGEFCKEFEFVISISQSKNCAETGIIRSREKTFQEVCEILDEAPSPHRNLPKKVGDCHEMTNKKNDFLMLPLDSHEQPMMLMAGRKFASLISKKSLGFSFIDDAKNGCISMFSGNVSETLMFERLCFKKHTEFELCENSFDFHFADGIAVYEGKYFDFSYRVESFILADKCAKVISVTTDCPIPVTFQVTPDNALSGKIAIGSGLCYFGSEKQGETGFIFGSFCGESKKMGAEYCDESGIEVYFDDEGDIGQYIFCFGFGDKEKNYDVCREVFENYSKVKAEAEAFGKCLEIDFSLMGEDLRRVLSKYFKEPSCGAQRGLIKTYESLHAYDLLLSLYTSLDFSKEAFVKGYFKAKKHLAKIICCICFCEYVRLKCGGDATMEYNGKGMYKEFLSCLFDLYEVVKKNTFLKDIYCTALRLFSALSESFGDTRTSLTLLKMCDRLEKPTDGGIFL